MKTIEILSDWAQVSNDNYGNKKVKVQNGTKFIESIVNKNNCLVPNGIHRGVVVTLDQYRHGFTTYESIYQIELDV